jgi:hypothetical protein
MHTQHYNRTRIKIQNTAAGSRITALDIMRMRPVHAGKPPIQHNKSTGADKYKAHDACKRNPASDCDAASVAAVGIHQYGLQACGQRGRCTNTSCGM